MRSLGTLLNIKLHFTSGHHPEANGQAERTNQTLEQYLRFYCNYQQSNWSDLLPLAEFAYNNASSESSGVSPFYANKGYHPQINISPEIDVASIRAQNYAVDLHQLHAELKVQLTHAQEQFSAQADRRRSDPPSFNIGDMVLLRSEHIRTTRPTKKLSAKFLGPFKILKKHGTHSYALQLPHDMRAVHPVFHVSQLKPLTVNEIPNRTQPPPPPVQIDEQLEYEVAEILDSKIDRRYRACPLRYLVRWAGYEGTSQETEWINAVDLTHSLDVASDFHTRYPDKPGSLEQLKSYLS